MALVNSRAILDCASSCGVLNVTEVGLMVLFCMSPIACRLGGVTRDISNRLRVPFKCGLSSRRLRLLGVLRVKRSALSQCHLHRTCMAIRHGIFFGGISNGHIISRGGTGIQLGTLSGGGGGLACSTHSGMVIAGWE